MGYHLGVVNHEKVFDDLPYTPVFVNDFSPETIEGREALSRLLTTTYDGDTIESVPKCACTDNPTRGVANKGKICPHCNSPVEDIFGSDINPVVWIRPPESISYLCNPDIWSILQEHFSKSDTSFISWFANKDYKYNPEHQAKIDNLRNAGFERGWEYFVNNYKDIITYLHQNDYGKTGDSKLATQIRRDAVFKLLVDNYDSTFTKYLPIPNRIAFVTETTTAGKVVDPSQVECLDAIRAICSVSGANVPHSQRVIENRVFRFHEQISNYYKVNYKDIIGRKEGMSRHHVFGSRLEFTARGVITSISNTHDYDECHMPWTMAIGLFRIHITNKLDKRGYTPRERSYKLSLAANHYDEEIAEILNELIEESPYATIRSGKKGIPIVLQRNPTLDRLSAQLLYVTKFKSDNLEDNTIGLSVLVLKGPNADFDGDALNLLLITDRKLFEQFYNMSTHLGIQDLHKPRSVSGIVSIPAPTCSTLCGYFSEHENLLAVGQ
tara:strand:+ start:87353 stop:88837 length:1485 start_codon:yes stop_codon:yes gene_type:complete